MSEQININAAAAQKLITKWPKWELKGRKQINLHEMAQRTPIAVDFLKYWFACQHEMVDASVDITEFGQMVLFNHNIKFDFEEGFLYNFFDNNNIGVFIDKNADGKFFYTFKSKTIIKTFTELYDTRSECQKYAFEKAFQFLEGTLTPKEKVINTSEEAPKYVSQGDVPLKDDSIIDEPNQWHAYSFDKKTYPENGTWIVEKDMATGKITVPFQFELHENDRELGVEPGTKVQWAYTSAPHMTKE